MNINVKQITQASYMFSSVWSSVRRTVWRQRALKYIWNAMRLCHVFAVQLDHLSCTEGKLNCFGGLAKKERKIMFNNKKENITQFPKKKKALTKIWIQESRKANRRTPQEETGKIWSMTTDTKTEKEEVDCNTLGQGYCHKQNSSQSGVCITTSCILWSCAGICCTRPHMLHKNTFTEATHAQRRREHF